MTSTSADKTDKIKDKIQEAKNHMHPAHNRAYIENLKLVVVLSYIGDNIAYQHGLHFCQEVYPYRNQNKV